MPIGSLCGLLPGAFKTARSLYMNPSLWLNLKPGRGRERLSKRSCSSTFTLHSLRMSKARSNFACAHTAEKVKREREFSGRRCGRARQTVSTEQRGGMQKFLLLASRPSCSKSYFLFIVGFKICTLTSLCPWTDEYRQVSLPKTVITPDERRWIRISR